jgi:hypothetical protein
MNEKSHGNDGKKGNDENHDSHHSHSSHEKRLIIPLRGDYQTLLSYQKAEVVYDITFRFAHKFLSKGDRTVERSACIREDQAGWFLGSDGIRLRLPIDCNHRFIAYQLRSPKHKDWMLNQSVGTTMPSLNQKIIARIPLVFCSLPKQRAIVKQRDALSEETQRLATIYERKLAALDDLKKSLLHQAFSGELQMSSATHPCNPWSKNRISNHRYHG